MNWIDSKYSRLLSGRLERFKKVHDNYNFRCPICSDSKKSKTKTRGWLLTKNGKTRFYCHNCGTSLTFQNFLKRVDINLYYDYVKESYLENRPEEKVVDDKKFVIERPKFDIKLKRVSQLGTDHPVKKYVENRKIPPEYHYLIYLAPRFKAWTESLVPGKFESLDHDEPRLIFPLWDEEKNFFGFQGRSFRKNSANKYITVLLDDRKPKLFGLERVDFTKTVYVVEGPIDSLFIDNCLASCGGRLDSNVGQDAVLIYDNEPRSKHTVQKMERAIADGYSIVIWPDNLNEKDINDMILSGKSRADIKTIIHTNTVTGLEAQLRLTEWKRV